MRSHSVSERAPESVEQNISESPPLSKIPPLAVHDLNKLYKGGTWANRDINLTANQAEILGILGPNGAGKTTLVRQITAELLPTSGQILVSGHDVVTESSKVKQMLGVVPQEATLFDYLTVHQHLRIFAKLRGASPRDARSRAEELVGELDLTPHRDVPLNKLSGGLKRRVMMGIAAVARPPLMILDEPTTGLDPQSRRNVWSLLKRYREEGTFVLLTTHNMEEAEALCDRVGIIQDGRLLALDTITNLRAQHGLEFKVTYFPNGPTGEEVTLHGSNERELVARVLEMGFSQYSVGRASLEDIYFALTGGMDEFDDHTN